MSAPAQSLPAVAVFAGDMDLAALDDRRRTTTTEAFETLLRGLETPLHLIVQIRRIRPAVAPQEPRARAPAIGELLDRAMHQHWNSRLTTIPAFTRSIALVPWCPPGDPGAPERVAVPIVEAVRRAGATARVVAGRELNDWIAATFGGHPEGRQGMRWQEWSGHARIGTTWVRGHRLRRLPGVPVSAGWLAPLLGVRAECDISLRLVPATVGEAVSTLGRRLRGLSAQRLLDLDRGALDDPWNDVAIDGAATLRAGLARNSVRPLRLALCALARGEDVGALDRASRDLQNAFSATLAQAEVTHFRHLDAAVTAMPLNRDRLGGHKLVDTRAAATCLPWTSAVLDDPGGYRLGCLRTTSAPVRLNLFDAGRHPNANVAILAASGHGKSFAIGTLVLEAVAQGRAATVIDPEEEYRSLVAAVGGEYLRLTPGSGNALNVFELADPADDEAAGQLVVDLTRVLSGSLCGEVESAHVDAAARHAVHAARAGGRVPVLGDCLEMLDASAPSVAIVLRRLCSGPLGELFSRPTSLRLDAGVTGISFRDLSAEFVPAATLLVARWLWSLVGRRTAQRHIVFDEVGMLALHPPLRALLVQLARRCRKYGASLVVATQNAQDLLQSDEGSVIATNCAVLLLGGHRAAEAARMERAFSLTDNQRRFLETAGRGEFLLIAGNRRAEVSIQVPALQARLLTART